MRAAYEAARRGVELSEVTYGWMSVRLLHPAELDDAQVGYSVGGDGEDFSGTAEGSWRPGWLVIAEEDLAGDPIFVDLDAPGFPVYTAAHGEGEWEPVALASSFDEFVAVLQLVDGASEGRSSPVALEQNPLPEETVREILRRIAEASPGADLDYWAEWLTPRE